MGKKNIIKRTRNKIILPMIVLLLLSCMAVLCICGYQYQNRMSENQSEVVTSAANTVENDINREKQLVEQAASIISDSGTLIPLLRKRDDLLESLEQFKKDIDLDFIMVTEADGTVIVRTQAPGEYGDKMSDLENVRSAMSGEQLTTISYGLHIDLGVVSTAPLFDAQGTLVGTVTAGFRLDNQDYIDKLRTLTGTEVSIFLDNKRIATTILGSDGEPAIGTIVDEKVWKVVSENNNYKGINDIMGRSAEVEYRPLNTDSGECIGIIFAGLYTEEMNRDILRFVLVGLIVAVLAITASIIIGMSTSENMVRPILMARQEAQKAKERLEIALSSSGGGAWSMDYDANIFSYDKRTSKFLHLPRDKEEITIDEFVSHLKQSKAEVTGNDYFGEMDRHTIYSDGKARVFNLLLENNSVMIIKSYGQQITDEQGEVAGVIGTCFDMTETTLLKSELEISKRTIEKRGIKEEDERAQVMLDATPLCVFLIDKDNTILDSNMEALRLFHYKEKEMLAKGLENLTPEFQPDGRKSVEASHEYIAKALTSSQSIRGEWTFKNSEEELIPTEITMIRIPWKGDYRVAIYAKDMRREIIAKEKQQKAEDESAEMRITAQAAIAASEAKSSFLSNMSHEIRTPMNAIMGLADLLSREELNKKQSSYVSNIRASSSSLLGIVNDILDFSKIEAGQMEIVPIDFSMSQFLDNIYSLFAFTAGEKGIYFNLKREKDLPEIIWGDDVRIKQVLINIIGNAIKFTSTGGVTLSVSTDSDNLVFEVADTGIGMKKQDFDVIFEEFSRVNLQQNRNVSGTGLGLTITKRLMDVMGGQIEVKSNYHEGSTFTLHIPYKEGNELNVKNDSNLSVNLFAPLAKVLVVDDNEVNLSVAKGILSLASVQADTALSGHEAIEMISRKRYDIVFMDHMMPDLNGVETTELLRKKYSKEELIVIALTANATGNIKEMLLDKGMNDYLSKPVTVIQLHKMLFKWLPKETIIKNLETQDIQAQNGQKSEETIAELKQINELDVTCGIDRVNNMSDVYLSTLEVFVKTYENLKENILQMLRGDNLQDVMISVHGLKGTLYTIGAMNLGDIAKEFEYKAKEGDLEYCKNGLPEFLSWPQKLADEISNILNKSRESSDVFIGPGDDDVLPTIINEIIRALEDFESDYAIELIMEIIHFDYGKERNMKLSKALEYSQMYDYLNAIEILRGI